MKLETDKERGTFNDWRLPTVKELFTLVDCRKEGPASNLEDTSSSNYWSSSVYIPDKGDAWFVNFEIGYVHHYFKEDEYYVRCVRVGIKGLEWSTSSTDKMAWRQARKYAKALVAPAHYKG